MGCRSPSSLSLGSVVWQANIPHLLHPGAEGAGVSSAKETSAAQIEYMVSKIALAALEDPKNTLGILRSVPLNTDCQFLRQISALMWLETWQDSVHYETLKLLAKCKEQVVCIPATCRGGSFMTE